ncbi:GDSL-type esterase/lipase family protein [Shewanella vesiculosa]|uniref:GDSL-type esterase/lipase family protein n=1 Tax=Shewanella vesiculosa TaxID=518738 RepID=A0ABV0FLV7_9GAMM
MDFYVGDIQNYDWYEKRLLSFDSYNILSDNSNVVIIGDSISSAIPSNEFSSEFSIYNFAISGDTTDSLLKRIDKIPFEKFDFVVFMIGVNDLGRGSSISKTFKNYKNILEKIRFYKCKVIVQPIVFTTRFKRDNIKIQKLNNLIKNFSEQEGITYFDVNSYLSTGNELNSEFTIDGMHLNNSAYNIWIGNLNELLLNTENKL